MKETIEIRQAETSDAPSIIQFQIAMAKETENRILALDTVQAGVAAIFDDPNRGIYVVAEIGSEIVGCCLITFEWSDWRNTNMWYLQSVYLIPDIRGSGAFSKLYQFVVNLAKDELVQVIRLYVEKANEHAQSVYQHLGMKKMQYDMYEIRLVDS